MYQSAKEKAVKVASGVALTGVLITASEWANAALPASVLTDAATTSADALTLGGLVLGLVISIALFRHLRSAK